MRSMFILSAVLALQSMAFAGPGRAPAGSPPPCSAAACRAKAAFAFEQLAAEGRATNTAPAPHAKTCSCGPDCECAGGVCPACPEVPTAAPSAAAKSVSYYREVWHTDARGHRFRELVPVYGGAPPAFAVSGCASGKCPLK